MDQRAYENLIPYNQSQKERYMEFLKSILAPAMGLHGVIGSFQYAFDLENAAGNQLDMIGEYVGVSRTLPFSIPEDEENRPTIVHTKCARSSHSADFPPHYAIYALETYSLRNYTPAIGSIVAVTFLNDIDSGNNGDAKFKLELTLTRESGGMIEVEVIPYDIPNLPTYPENVIAFRAGETRYFERVSGGYSIMDYNPEEVKYPSNTRSMKDDEYRMMIKLRIARNQWDGTNESAIRIYKTILGDSINLQQIDKQDYSIDIRIIGTSTSRLRSILEGTDNLMIPAGIQKNVIEVENDVEFGISVGASLIGIEIYEHANMLGE